MPTPAEITKFNAIGAYGSYATALSADFTPVATSANGNYYQSSGNDLLVALNTDGALARTITITSVPDDKGRSKDITTYSIAAGKCAFFGPFKTDGWSTCGKVFFQTSDPTLHVAVIALRPQ